MVPSLPHQRSVGVAAPRVEGGEQISASPGLVILGDLGCRPGQHGEFAQEAPVGAMGPRHWSAALPAGATEVVRTAVVPGAGEGVQTGDLDQAIHHGLLILPKLGTTLTSSRVLQRLQPVHDAASATTEFCERFDAAARALRAT